ncbi:phage tail protein [Vibrio metschnikovii]|uniref:phage tail-collar fiber domain-containing protein n=1 Tax=Vibrio metschnikovii TaxID=28172 RepID=UPI001C3042D7|nr:phage tail protein [Vibrio metschnikovii]
MKTVIPIEFESYLVEKINSGLAPDMNEVVFAYIPDLDINEDIDRAKGLPPESTWVHKQSIDKASKLNRNTLIYSVVVPSKYTFTFNAVYLHDKHTQNSCGLVIHKLDELKEIGTTMTRSFAQQYLGAAEIADIHVTPETWQIDFSARIEGIDDDVRLNNLDHYGHTAFISGFNVEKISANEYRVREGVAYVGGLRCELKNTVTKTITAKPDGIYLDVVREGTILSWWINTPVVRTSKTPLSDYIDNSGNQHYVTRIAGIRSDGSIEDWREWNIVSQAEAEEGESSTPRKWTALRVLQAIKAWASKNLGTAASRNVMTSPTDMETPNALMPRGAFGIGDFAFLTNLVGSGITTWTLVAKLRGINTITGAAISFEIFGGTNVANINRGKLSVHGSQRGNNTVKVEVYKLGPVSALVGYVQVGEFDFDIYVRRQPWGHMTITGGSGFNSELVKDLVDLTEEPEGIVYVAPNDILHQRNTGDAVTKNAMTSPTDMDTPDALMPRGAGGLLSSTGILTTDEADIPEINMFHWLGTGGTGEILPQATYGCITTTAANRRSHTMAFGENGRIFHIRKTASGAQVAPVEFYHTGNLPAATESDAASTSDSIKAWSPQRIRQAIDARIPNTSEAVNSYCLCIHNQEAGLSPTIGQLISAARLMRCNAAGTAIATTGGTWRLMTPISINSNNPAERVGLFVRVN